MSCKSKKFGSLWPNSFK